ncbi:MAG: BLUF domain-containing protein [Steroidobacteraceae bacterium]|jgi:hypothetical protein
MTIVQLVYASNLSTQSPMDLKKLLVSARARNMKSHVTGYLCFRNDSFLQVLEGGPAAVSSVFASIANDPRHRNVVLLGYEKAVRRRFSTWSMGYVADFGDSQGILLSYSAQDEFAPHEMDHRSAIEFLSEVASGARRASGNKGTD